MEQPTTQKRRAAYTAGLQRIAKGEKLLAAELVHMQNESRAVDPDLWLLGKICGGIWG
jgi:hypothetical protein